MTLGSALPMHLPQEAPSILGLVDVTRVQGTCVPGCCTERLVELELDHEADEVPGGMERGEDTGLDPTSDCAGEDVVSPHLLGCTLPVWNGIIGFEATPASSQSNLLMPFFL